MESFDTGYIIQYLPSKPGKNWRINFCYFNFISQTSFFAYNLIKRYLIPWTYFAVLKNNSWNQSAWRHQCGVFYPRPLDLAENFTYPGLQEKLNQTIISGLCYFLFPSLTLTLTDWCLLFHPKDMLELEAMFSCR